MEKGWKSRTIILSSNAVRRFCLATDAGRCRYIDDREVCLWLGRAPDVPGTGLYVLAVAAGDSAAVDVDAPAMSLLPRTRTTNDSESEHKTFNIFKVNIILCHFYRAMLCIRGTSHGPVSVCLSVRPSQVGVLLKRLNIGSHKQHHTTLTC